MPTGEALSSAALPIPLTLADALILMSLWKPLLFLVPFVIWARVVSAVLDKHSAQWYLPRQTWNLVHMSCGLVALLGAIGLGSLVGGELGFVAAFFLAIIVLSADIAVYVLKTNPDERVTEKGKLNFVKLFGLEGGTGGGKKNKKGDKQTVGIRFTIKQPDEKGKLSVTLTPPAPETPELLLRVEAESLVIRALAARASQLEIGPAREAQQYAARWLVDGVYQSGDGMPAANAIRLMDFWKMAAKQDVNDRRRKQTGDISLEDTTGKRLVRVTSMGAQGGMRLTLLFDPERAVTRKPEELGLLETQMGELKTMTGQKGGVVLLGAPPDGGRTTLFYSVLRLHDAYINNVQTVEAEPQAFVEGVRMNKWDPTGAVSGTDAAIGPEFSTLVRSILRRDPDVVGVADLPDAATAKEIARADLERTRVYISVKASDPYTAIQAWVKAVGDTRLAADALRGVVIGKVFRKLCTNCRVEYPPSPDMLRKLGIGEAKVQRLFKKGGQVLIKNKPEVCPVCAGIGYVGLEGVFEVCSIPKEDRDLIAAGDFAGLKSSFRKRHIPTLQQVAIRKAVDGVTSVEEITRVTAAESGPDAPSPGGKPATAPQPKPAPAPGGPSAPAAKPQAKA